MAEEISKFRDIISKELYDFSIEKKLLTEELASPYLMSVYEKLIENNDNLLVLKNTTEKYRHISQFILLERTRNKIKDYILPTLKGPLGVMNCEKYTIKNKENKICDIYIGKGSLTIYVAAEIYLVYNSFENEVCESSLLDDEYSLVIFLCILILNNISKEDGKVIDFIKYKKERKIT